jgi:hypothetical protein
MPISLTFFTLLFSGIQNFTNDMRISLSLYDAEALFDTLIKVSETGLVNFPFRDATNPYCWLSLMPAAELDSRGTRLPGLDPSISLEALAVTVSKLNLNISCIHCTSPGMPALIETLSKPESADAVTLIANDLLKFGSQLITGNLVQDLIDRALYEAPRHCPHHPLYVPDGEWLEWEPLNFDRSLGTSSLLILLAGVGLSLLGAISVVVLVVRWIVGRRHRLWLRTLPTERILALERQHDANKQMETELNEDTKAMVVAKEIPLYVRYIMPAIILGNIAFFLSGHLSIAAETKLELQIAGEPFSLDQFFAFSIIQSTLDMWEAGAQQMAIFILIFSGIWPYVKQFTTLFCWLAPPRLLSISTRGSIYLWLDTLAKWSMVDIFVLLVSMVAFRYE